MEYFAGLDVSLRSCALCIVDARGSVAFECELGCDVDEIAQCLKSFDHPLARIGFEAGTMSQHLFYGLTNNGFDVVCMEARQVSAAFSAMRKKTDKNDSRGIDDDAGSDPGRRSRTLPLQTLWDHSLSRFNGCHATEHVFKRSALKWVLSSERIYGWTQLVSHC